MTDDTFSLDTDAAVSVIRGICGSIAAQKLLAECRRLPVGDEAHLPAEDLGPGAGGGYRYRPADVRRMAMTIRNDRLPPGVLDELGRLRGRLDDVGAALERYRADTVCAECRDEAADALVRDISEILKGGGVP